MDFTKLEEELSSIGETLLEGDVLSTNEKRKLEMMVFNKESKDRLSKVFPNATPEKLELLSKQYDQMAGVSATISDLEDEEPEQEPESWQDVVGQPEKGAEPTTDVQSEPAAEPEPEAKESKLDIYGDKPETQVIPRYKATAEQLAKADEQKTITSQSGEEIHAIIPADDKKDFVYWYMTNIEPNLGSSEKRKSISQDVITQGLNIFRFPIYNNAEIMQDMVTSISKLAVSYFSLTGFYKTLLSKAKNKGQANKIISDAVNQLSMDEIIEEGFKRTVTGYGQRALRKDDWNPYSGNRFEELVLLNGIAANKDKVLQLVKDQALAMEVDLGSSDVSLSKETGEGTTVGDTVADDKSTNPEIDEQDKIARQAAARAIPKSLSQVYEILGVPNNDQKLLQILNQPLL